MSSAIQGELVSFAAELLEQCGGLVEWKTPNHSGVALAPAEIAGAFGLAGDVVPFSCQPLPNGLHVSLVNDFLDQAEQVLQGHVPRVGRFRLPPRNLKSGDMQEVVDRTFHWHNARVRVRQVSPGAIEYHSWWFRAVLLSEEVWECCLNASVHAESLAPLSLGDLLKTEDLQPRTAGDSRQRDTLAAAAAEAGRMLRHQAQAFLGRMDQRLERDCKRLRSYYGALRNGAERPARRGAVPPAPEELAAKRRAVDLELRRKLVELEERYRAEAQLTPIVKLEVEVTGLRIELAVRRKLAEREHALSWNPLTKRLDPLVCCVCGLGSYAISFTNDTVEPLCPACAACESA